MLGLYLYMFKFLNIFQFLNSPNPSSQTAKSEIWRLRTHCFLESQMQPELEPKIWTIYFLKINLFESQIDRHREKSSIYWFSPQMTTVIKVGPGQSQETRIPPSSPCGWQRLKHLGPSYTAIRDALTGSWSEVGTPGVKTVFRVQNAGIAHGSLTHCTTAPDLGFHQ